MDTIAQLAGSTPQDHGGSALAWVLAVGCLALLGWLIKLVATRLVEGQDKLTHSMDELTDVVRTIPSAISSAVHEALRDKVVR